MDDVSPEFLTDNSNMLLINHGKWAQYQNNSKQIGGSKTSNFVQLFTSFEKHYVRTVLSRHILFTIELDDSQSGFRWNRRRIDNIPMINNILEQRNHKAGAYIIAIDFNKAFDRCRIATLVKKLSDKGVKLQRYLLRDINCKDMCTDAEAQLHLNGKILTNFKVKPYRWHSERV